MLKDKIIVALDVDCLNKAESLVADLAPYVGCFKVGLELLTAEGAPRVVDFVHRAGGQVFFDGKFHDIPNTIEKASRATAALGVKMFNVYASAGIEAMKAANHVKGKSLLLAVTVLTSMNEESCRSVYGTSVEDTVKRFAKQALEAGVDGLVCSSQDLLFLNSDPDMKKLMKITPGVRPAWAESNDQKRVFTPREAIQAGATALVIGRPITQPPWEIGSPVEAVKRILDELAQVL